MSSSLKLHSKIRVSKARQDESLVPTLILGIKVVKTRFSCVPTLLQKNCLNHQTAVKTCLLSYMYWGVLRLHTLQVIHTALTAPFQRLA